MPAHSAAVAHSRSHNYHHKIPAHSPLGRASRMICLDSVSLIERSLCHVFHIVSFRRCLYNSCIKVEVEEVAPAHAIAPTGASIGRGAVSGCRNSTLPGLAISRESLLVSIFRTNHNTIPQQWHRNRIASRNLAVGPNALLRSHPPAALHQKRRSQPKPHQQ